MLGIFHCSYCAWRVEPMRPRPILARLFARWLVRLGLKEDFLAVSSACLIWAVKRKFAVDCELMSVVEV